MAFNAGSITTSLDFEFSQSAKRTLAQYEAALKKIDAKKATVELDVKADTAAITKFEKEVKDADKLKADADLKATVDKRGFQEYDKAGTKAKKTSDDVEKANKKTEGSFKRSGKAAAGYAAGFVGAAGVISVLRGSVQEAEAAQKAQAQVEASLKATGEAAGLTADQIADMSSKLGRRNFIDNDEFMKASSVMLTFKAVTKDTFESAMQSAADLQGKFGGDLQKSTIQLGKALQDPIKGISALARVGVSFSEDQKEALKGLVADGKMVEAQQIILKEINSQVAGSARANASASDRMRLTYKDLQEQIGTALIPAMEQLAKLFEAFNNLSPGMKKAIVAIAGAAVAAVAVAKLVSALSALKGVFMALKGLGLASMLFNPWLLAIVAVAGAAFLIIKNWDKVKKFLGKTWNWIKNAAKDVAGFVSSAARKGFLGPVPFIIANWKKVRNFLGDAWNWMKTAIKNVGQVVNKAARSGFLGPVPLIISRWGDIKKFFRGLPNTIVGFLSGIGGKIVKPFTTAFGALRKAISTSIRWIKKAFNDVVSWVSKAYNKLPGFVKKGISLVGKGIEFGAGLLGLSEGGRVGPSSGGPQMFVAGEGGKDEWVISQEGNRRKNQMLLVEAAAAIGVPGFKKGGKPKSSKSLRKQVKGAVGQQTAQEETIRILQLQAERDGTTTPAELDGINAANARLLALYAKERSRINQLLRALDGDMGRVRGQLGGARGTRKERLQEKLTTMREERATLRERLRELNSSIKVGNEELLNAQAEAARQAASEAEQGRNDAAVKTSFDDRITLANGELARDPKGSKTTLIKLLGDRLEELKSRLGAAIGQQDLPMVTLLTEAVRTAQSDLEGATGSSLGFTEQVRNLTSARMGLYQQAGNSFGGTVTNNKKNVTVNIAGLTKVPDPHLWARRVGAELALV